MSYPRQQFVLAITKGRRTRFYYGEKLGDLVTTKVKVGDDFRYAKLTTGDWAEGTRTREKAYVAG